ncbi:transmembrane E3 ubiquitin-protein ligase FLY1-like isoform X3 [Nymphaea colorata]|uniref:transmembrane E3 ubiquitin-protein ligase FLY1-like isoform X3 n=1 Tax=Nymphaea colorata TaxID=210225 RepID=UPI00129EAA52|nr:transmembrane E3 ubiquitin-protein ligase FLY1-like isoform X3 [Nymphaea colorata]
MPERGTKMVKNSANEESAPRRCRVRITKFVVLISFIFNLFSPLLGLRPLREMDGSHRGQASSRLIQNIIGSDDTELGPYSAWNITGTYKGTWGFVQSNKSSSRFADFQRPHGFFLFELVSSLTKITGVHYIHGYLMIQDVSDNEHDLGNIQLKVEGVYIWPFRQLRLIANSGTEEMSQEDDLFPSSPYHLLLQSTPHYYMRRAKDSVVDDISKHCNLQIAAQISRISTSQNDGVHVDYHMEGLVDSPSVDDDGECLSPIILNATSINTDVYYNKAVNYTLMVTFVSFLQVLLLIRQMEHSSTQSGAAKVSLLMIGQQAIMDAYLCLLHLTAGILVESLFNAFATAAFFKFVVFAIFEMRYLLAIWKASRSMNSNEGWETMRRDLSTLYSRFYGILLGGIVVMYEMHNFLRPLLLVLYSFWIPQIVTNVIKDTRKPLHPYYILGITVTRLAIPLYIFGCPNNFMRIDTDWNWCLCLMIFVGVQAIILLLQHYLGSRWFIPRQILPEKYNYHRKIEQSTNHASDCVICMTAIDLSQHSDDFMVTPCEHLFHSGCLQRWMDIKMECPTCRRPLPPV